MIASGYAKRVQQPSSTHPLAKESRTHLLLGDTRCAILDLATDARTDRHLALEPHLKSKVLLSPDNVNIFLHIYINMSDN